MIKTIYLAKRNPATTHEEFLRNWREHAALAGSFPAVGRNFLAVVQCKQIPGLDRPGLSTEFDGANLLSLTSLLDSLEVYDQPGIETLLRDELRVFSGYVGESSITVHESVLAEKPLGSVVLLEFVRRRPEIGVADFVKAWTGSYARTLTGSKVFAAAAGRYVHNHVILPTPPGYDYSGVSETWFDSLDDATAFLDGVDEDPTLREPDGFEIGLRTLMDLNHAWFA
ncbi:MAG TPA: hypothetical protein VHC18_01555 [Amycolatopsis sp.]|nr:hypothetical protein [Amycolatopsis sp.]